MTATRDRYGELVDDEEVSTADALHDEHTCVQGWLSPPDADLAIPCPTCRPHLIGRSADLRRHLQGAPQ